MKTREIPQALLDLADGQYSLVSLGQAAEHGVEARRCFDLARQGEWPRVCRAVYDIGSQRPPDGGGRAAYLAKQQAVGGLLSYGPDAVAVGLSALALHDVQGLPTALSSEVAVPAGRTTRRHTGVRLRQYDDGMAVEDVGGWRAVGVERAIAQAIPRLDRDTAVCILDSAQHLDLIGPDGLAVAAALLKGRRGAATAKQWWSLTSGLAETPLETRVRLKCFDRNIAPDALQVPIHDSHGVLIGRGDMGWLLPDGRWLIVEADGVEPHSQPAALLHDRRRQNEFLQANIVVLRFTWADLWVPGYIATTIQRVLDAAGWRPSTPAEHALTYEGRALRP